MSCDRGSKNVSDSSQDANRNDITGASQFYLGDEALRREIEHALDGDEEAADRVYMHFTTFQPNDRDTLLFWMRVAVENGSAGYMNLYASALYEQGGEERCRRALFWLRRSSQTAPELAERNERLRKLIEQDSECRRREPSK